MTEARWAVGQGWLIIRQGDITTSRAAAIVNAANSQLAGGSGVDGAIHRAAGPELLKAGRDYVAVHGPVPAGRAAITPAFNLPARAIIHAVGPIWRGGDQGEPEALASAYRSCLMLAKGQDLKDIAFPAISCGAYGYPLHLAAPIAINALRLGLSEGLVQEAILYIFGEEALTCWQDAATRLLGKPAG